MIPMIGLLQVIPNQFCDFLFLFSMHFYKYILVIRRIQFIAFISNKNIELRTRIPDLVYTTQHENKFQNRVRKPGE